MSIAKSRNILVIFSLIALLPINTRGDEDLQWRQRFKRARYNILNFKIAVNGYYNAVLFQGQAGSGEKKRLINGSIAARQSLALIKECPEEYKEAREVYDEMYESLRKMELMATSRGVAHSNFEKQKELKKKVDNLMDEFEGLLKLK